MALNKGKKLFRLIKQGNLVRIGEILLNYLSATKLSCLIYYSRFFMLSYRVNAKDIRHGLVKLKTKFANVNDIERLCQLFPNKDEYKLRFLRGDICVIAEMGSEIVGMLWMQFNKNKEGMQQYTISLPAKSIWTHDGYVHTNYRIKGIWLDLVSEKIRYCLNHGIACIYTVVYSGNSISLNTHRRFGYTIVEDVIYLKVFGLKIRCVKKIDEIKKESKSFWDFWVREKK